MKHVLQMSALVCWSGAVLSGLAADVTPYGACRLNGANVTVENCRFRNITGAPLRFQIEYTWNAWCEGFGCTNVVVRDCDVTFDRPPYKLLPYAGSIYLKNTDRVTVSNVRVTGATGAEPGVWRP